MANNDPGDPGQRMPEGTGGGPTSPYPFPGHPTGAGPYGGYASPQMPTIPAGPPQRRRGTGTLVALTLLAAVLGGGVGGGVGYSLADRGGSGGSTGVLSRPLPPVDEAATPVGSVEVVAQKVLPSVVQLRVAGQRTAGEGSGMLLSSDGLILTNNHVVESAANGGSVVAVFQDGITAQARIVGRDPSSDLAVLRARNVSELVPVELGNSDSLRVGQQVVAFGSPLGLGGTVTTGIVSALDRAVSVGGESGASEATVLNAVQTDAAINPGNSGGPLVDMQGRVVGINSAIATTGTRGGSIGVGFAIPVTQAKRIAEELERTGKASRAVLGVGVTDDPSATGARIQSVTPGGPAETAGIKQGDIVVRLGDQRVTSGVDLQAAVRSQVPGEVVKVELSDRTVKVTLGTATG
ncbi:serine protease PepD [Pseudonocardia asaccharolytica DSM 44247 = NBRC 16224]|uniref:Serine protease PepD n=2 Tax=Pseudonocardia asaccharolytica TaxID=54010 RepID=A0A511D1T6_9PSEU|nr:serine protease PepD [Pseudonocardia asaccharolytica DSM 44247 = NBRC 16224]